MRNAENEITFSDVHLGLYRDALALRTMPGVEGDRRAYVAPRGSGKSTCLFVITTLWLACHHPTFVTAFSASSTQANDHLHRVRGELFENRLIQIDYPDACKPATNRAGRAIADSGAMLYMANGFCFSARGVDTEVLGLVDPLNRRPQIIWLDDVEGGEGKYSVFQAGKRLRVITDTILPMNDRAHVRMVGTVTVPGGIVHQLINTVTTNEPPAEWIVEERFRVTYFPPIVCRLDGTERSCWPGKWSIGWLQKIRGTRAFKKNMANLPAGFDGTYWSDDDITYGDVPAITRRVLFIDGSVTSKPTSDDTGIAIIGYSPTDGRCLVEYAEGVQLTGGPLRNHLAKVIKKHPGRIAGIVVEVNQGGDLWVETLSPLGLKVITTWSGEPKHVRMASGLDLYQKPRPLVVHARKFPKLEAQMIGYPIGVHDDVADVVCIGVLAFLKPVKGRTVGASVESYR
jgi:hypothetical protein